MLGGVRKKNKVLIPTEIIESRYQGEIYGKHVEDSGVFNIYSDDMIKCGLEHECLGRIVGSKENVLDKQLIGYWHGDEITFLYGEEILEVEQYNLVQNIFSRNTGILESAIMCDKIAIILGCGSVGSLIAVELAKAGVGNYVLVDNDTIEYHNICRHQCGIDDVGKYKVNALSKRIKNINPSANIEQIVTTVELVKKEIFDRYCVKDKSIIIGCADNRAADVYANSIAVMYKIPFVSVGFWERAFAGEIFYYLPNRGMTCYKCALGDGGELSNRTDANRRIYTNQEDLSKVVFEPGISVDINFVTTIGIKIILDILNIGNENFTPRLIDTLQQYTLVCNTNKVEVGGEMAEIFSYPLQVTTSLKVQHGKSCPPCEYE